MNTNYSFNPFPSLSLSSGTFVKFKNIIEKNVGIRMPATKISLLESRLQKRIKNLNLNSFEEYYEYLFNNNNNEFVQMINSITTNKTDFFRENDHFNFLKDNILKREGMVNSLFHNQKFRIWSAGCSSGEEAYTLGILLAENLKIKPNFFYEICASDIDTEKLEEAKNGIYSCNKIQAIPTKFLHQYFLRSKDKTKEMYRVKPFLRSAVDFYRSNLIDFHNEVPGNFDVIFCRNVLIYFERDNQRKILSMLLNKLKNGGYIFLGHSESIFGMNLPLQNIAPSIYRKIVG